MKRFFPVISLVMLILYYFILTFVIRFGLMGFEGLYEIALNKFGADSIGLIWVFALLPALSFFSSMLVMLYFPLGAIFYGGVKKDKVVNKPLYILFLFVLLALVAKDLVVIWWLSNNLSYPKIGLFLKAYFSAVLILGVLWVAYSKDSYNQHKGI